MPSVAPTEGRYRAAPTPRCGNFGRLATISSKVVKWRATADENGHYCFAVAL